MNKIFNNSILFACIAMISFASIVSCVKSDLSEDGTLDALANETVLSLEQRGNLGAHGCYDLVFPITIKFSDGTTKVIASHDSLKRKVRRHLDSTGTKRERPEFVFPISVIAEDGSVIQVNSKEELQTLREACPKRHNDSLMHKHGGKHHGIARHDSLCFTLVFPITVKKADSTTVTVNSREELKALGATEHKRGRGHGKKHGVANQLAIVFPISVKKSDGSTVAVNSKEELKALRESCN